MSSNSRSAFRSWASKSIGDGTPVAVGLNTCMPNASLNGFVIAPGVETGVATTGDMAGLDEGDAGTTPRLGIGGAATVTAINGVDPNKSTSASNESHNSHLISKFSIV